MIAQTGEVKIRSERPFQFSGEVPGDKSITHRALIIGALAEGETVLEGALRSEDTEATLRILAAIGIPLQEENGRIHIFGRGGRFRDPEEPLDAKNSGTTARLLLGLLAGAGVRAVLTGDASLKGRPMERVVSPLRAAGASLRWLEGPDRLPVEVLPASLVGAVHIVKVASAQVKSALLLAGLFAQGRTEIRLPRLTRDHTERLLQEGGVSLRAWPSPDLGETWVLDGPARPKPLGTLRIPGDPSSAAFLWAAAALTGGQARVANVLLNARRTGFLRLLETMGVRVDVVAEAGGPEPKGTVTVSGRPVRPAEVSPSEVADLIDELPVAAVVMTAAPGISRVRGAGELRWKESNRLEAVARLIRAFGGECQVEGDGWTILGGRRLRGADIHSGGDHRIAMAAGVLALAAQGETCLHGAEAVSVSYPGFFEGLRLGGAEVRGGHMAGSRDIL